MNHPNGPAPGPQPQQPPTYGPTPQHPGQPHPSQGQFAGPAPHQVPPQQWQQFPQQFQQPVVQPGFQPQRPVVQLAALGPVPLAGLGSRLGARLLDALIVGIPLLLVVFLLFAVSATVRVTGLSIVFTILSVAVIFVGPVLYEVSMIATIGATFGKRIAGVCVLDEHPGLPPGWGGALIRWFIPFVCGMVPLLGLICWLSPAFDNVRKQGWHDRVARTVVIATR